MPAGVSVLGVNLSTIILEDCCKGLGVYEDLSTKTGKAAYVFNKAVRWFTNASLLGIAMELSTGCPRPTLSPRVAKLSLQVSLVCTVISIAARFLSHSGNFIAQLDQHVTKVLRAAAVTFAVIRWTWNCRVAAAVAGLQLIGSAISCLNYSCYKGVFHWIQKTFQELHEEGLVLKTENFALDFEQRKLERLSKEELESDRASYGDYLKETAKKAIRTLREEKWAAHLPEEIHALQQQIPDDEVEERLRQCFDTPITESKAQPLSPDRATYLILVLRMMHFLEIQELAPQIGSDTKEEIPGDHSVEKGNMSRFSKILTLSQLFKVLSTEEQDLLLIRLIRQQEENPERFLEMLKLDTTPKRGKYLFEYLYQEMCAYCQQLYLDSLKGSAVEGET